MLNRKNLIFLLYLTFFLIGITIRTQAISLNGNFLDGLQNGVKAPLGEVLQFQAYPVCGNNVVESGEVCDPPGSTNPNNPCQQCSPDCKSWVNKADGTSCPDDGNPCTNDYCSSGSCTHPNKASGTDCGDCKVCDGSGNCIEKTKPTCTICQDGPYCDAATDTWYCTNKPTCTLCGYGNWECYDTTNCDSRRAENHCSDGSCVFYQWQVDVGDSARVCDGLKCGNAYLSGDICYYNCKCSAGSPSWSSVSCPASKVSDSTCYYGRSCSDTSPYCSYSSSSTCKCSSCSGYCTVGSTCYYNDACTANGESYSSGCLGECCECSASGPTPNSAKCSAGWVCGPDCTCKSTCQIGSVCKYGSWVCDGNCRRKREVYKYDSNCNCVFDSYEYENAPYGQHCSGGSFTSSGYCGSSSVYCSGDRYRQQDRYECDGNNNCNVYDYTDTLQDCGATSYSCLTTCKKRYTYTCSGGTCGTYTSDYNCPIDTSCSGGTCSSSNPCSTGSYECQNTCTKGKRQYRCDGSGNCNRFWQWVDSVSCNPFSCSGGSCSGVCEADCGADAACDGKTPGSSCGTGRTCNSNCQCIVTACSAYSTQASCNADPNCAWCSGDNTCKDKTSVVCQPPSCSADGKSKCTSSCTWQDCGSTDSSCYCSAGSCVACSGSSPKCSDYKCVQCLTDSDCPYCYQKCSSTNTCYDFRSQLTGTCRYYDYCTSAACSTDPAYCYNVDAGLCANADWRCHTWFSC